MGRTSSFVIALKGLQAVAFADLEKVSEIGWWNRRKSDHLAVEFYERILDFDDRPDLERANGGNLAAARQLKWQN